MTTAERLAPATGEVSPMTATDQAEQFDQHRSDGMNTDVVDGESQRQPETADAEQEDKYKDAAERACKEDFPSVASVLYTAATSPHVKNYILERLRYGPHAHVAGLSEDGGSVVLEDHVRQELFNSKRPVVAAAENQFTQEFTTIVQETPVKVEAEILDGNALSQLTRDVEFELASIRRGTNLHLEVGGELFEDSSNEEARFPTYTKYNQEMAQYVQEHVLNHWIPAMTTLPGDPELTQAVQESCTKLFEAKARAHEQLASIYGQQELLPGIPLRDTMTIFSSIVPE